MSDVSILYRNSEIASLSDTGLRTLETSGKYCDSDINVVYTKPSAPTPVMQSKSKTYTPTTSQQTETVTADSGYDGLSQVAVTVDAIPSQYIVPAGTKSITANGTGIDVAQYALADVAVQPTLKYATLRPDATVVKTYSYDKLLVTDSVIESIPAYSTTSVTLKAAAALTETYTLDYANYDYLIAVRCLTYPIYNTTTVGKGRPEWHFTQALYEIAEIPANTFTSIRGERETAYTSRTAALLTLTAMSRLIYWSSASAVSTYSTTAYGICQSITAPSLSSGVVTFTSPQVNARGSSTYFASTYWGYVTDIRVQWVQEVYRVAKGSLNMDGFNAKTNIMHIVDCVNSSSRTLT